MAELTHAPGTRPAPQPLRWTPELVARFWDGLAQAGLDDALAFGRMARRCIHWLIAKYLTPDGQHLDYGAGGGEVAEYLINQGFPFAVLEPSAERLARTTERLHGLPGFLGGGKPVAEQSYDAVTCFEVLEHILDADWNRVCDELAGHVRPGGVLIVSTPNDEDMRRDTVYCPVSNTCFHRWQHVRRISAATLTSAFAARGIRKLCAHQLDFVEGLFEPYLHMMGMADPPPREPGQPEEIVPLHIHWLLHDIDGVMGGASRLLYVGRKPAASVHAGG